MKTFLNDLKPFLKNFPDNNEIDTIEEIKNKSEVLHLGLDFSNFKARSDKKLIRQLFFGTIAGNMIKTLNYFLM